MEPKHQNLKNKLEKLNGLEGVFGIFAYENNEKIYMRYPTKEVLEDADKKNISYIILDSDENKIKIIKISDYKREEITQMINFLKEKLLNI